MWDNCEFQTLIETLANGESSLHSPHLGAPYNRAKTLVHYGISLFVSVSEKFLASFYTFENNLITSKNAPLLNWFFGLEVITKQKPFERAKTCCSVYWGTHLTWPPVREWFMNHGWIDQYLFVFELDPLFANGGLGPNYETNTTETLTAWDRRSNSNNCTLSLLMEVIMRPTPPMLQLWETGGRWSNSNSWPLSLQIELWSLIMRRTPPRL